MEGIVPEGEGGEHHTYRKAPYRRAMQCPCSTSIPITEEYKMKDLYRTTPHKTSSTTQPGRYGYTTPALPERPGWSDKSEFRFGVDVVNHLPNISIFISRLRSICSIAMEANMNESLFQNDVNGLHSISTLFGRECTHSEYEIDNLTSPGSNIMYSGSLRLWKNAAVQLCIPEELIVDKHNVKDTWSSALRFDSEEAGWFGILSNMMLVYSKYWKGSAFLDSCPPNNSAAGAVVCYDTSGDIFRSPKWNEPTRTNENQVVIKGHYSLRWNCTMTFDAKTAHEELPQEAELAGCFNLPL
nr:hypothetical protein [Tanacetum cinerariifolium]